MIIEKRVLRDLDLDTDRFKRFQKGNFLPILGKVNT